MHFYMMYAEKGLAIIDKQPLAAFFGLALFRPFCDLPDQTYVDANTGSVD